MPLSERILTWLRPGRPGAAAPPPGPEQAHRLFAVRARSFHDLLDARAAALKAMAELEAALREGNTLSMSFIRARCTLVTVNVFKIIRHCNQIVDGRHDGLERAFARLRQRIETILDGEPEPVTGEMLLDLVRIDRTLAGLAGEPMTDLAEAGASGIRIPSGFVLTAAATGLFFQRNQLYRKINHILQQTEAADPEDLHDKSAAIRELIRSAPMPPELEALLLDQFDRLTGATAMRRVAVRSSAIGRDLGRASCAGLDHTELDVSRDSLINACKTVLASKYTPLAITYRLDRGLLHEQCDMAIGVLVMVEAAQPLPMDDQPLLQGGVTGGNPMDGSPVQRILAEVLALIAPLNPPGSPGFRAARCQTLHDIMRFCHDRAKAGMFAFSLRSCHGKGAAKRLRGALAGQWWVVDLDGAFAPGYDHSRPEIELADIACPPLHALWSGMHHPLPQGPPASRSRPVVAALIRAVVRNGLDPARTFLLLRKKNYFLLSQKYCSLTLHPGGCLARIEALLDDRSGGSSITFRCTGGSRHIRRVDVLAEILDHFGCRVDRAGDILTAWADQESGPIFLDRLKILGYLAIHAQELDAGAADAKTARLCRDTFIQAIKEMLHHE